MAFIAISVALTGACQGDSDVNAKNSPEINRNVDLPAASQENLRALLTHTQSHLVHVEGGRFTMGEEQSTVTRDDGSTETGYFSCSVTHGEATPHPVELDSYHINAYETTYGEQDLWAAFTDSKPIRHTSGHAENRSADHPAGTRTWHDAKNYCGWLEELTGLPFDLPTEAQWEFAARSRGRKVPFATANGRWKDPETFKNGNWRDDPQYLGEYGNTSKEHPAPATPLPVGIFPPNPLGLYDMTGNVHEWVDDWYAKDYYERSPVDNPQGPDNGTQKILRGGATEQSAHCNTVYNRYPQEPVEEPAEVGPIDLTEIGFGNRGFRCALDLDRPLEDGELVERARERGYLD